MNSKLTGLFLTTGALVLMAAALALSSEPAQAGSACQRVTIIGTARSGAPGYGVEQRADETLWFEQSPFNAWAEFPVFWERYRGADYYHVEVYLPTPEVILPDYAGLLDADDGLGILWRDYDVLDWRHSYDPTWTGNVVWISAPILQSGQRGAVAIWALGRIIDPETGAFLPGEPFCGESYLVYFEIARPDDPAYPPPSR